MENYDRELFKKYLEVFKNQPPKCIRITEIEYTNTPKHVKEISNCYKHPIRIIKDPEPGEMFVQMYHTDISPNIMPRRYYISSHGRLYDCFRERYVSVVYPNEENNSKQKHYAVVDPTCIKDSTHLCWPVLNVHRLVCYYFHYFPDCYPYYQVNHKDSNKNNNNADNLEWVDNNENEKHRYREGLYQNIGSGENQHKASAKENDIRKVCEMLKKGYRIIDISRETGLSVSIVQKVRYKTHWTKISREYDLPDVSIVSKRYISKEQAEEICRMLSEKKSVIEICKATGCNSKQVLGIKYDGLFPETRHKYGL